MLTKYDRLTDRSLDILHHLSQRGSAWPEASSAAIRNLRARMACRSNNQTQDRQLIIDLIDGDSSPIASCTREQVLTLGEQQVAGDRGRDLATKRKAAGLRQAVDSVTDGLTTSGGGTSYSFDQTTPHYAVQDKDWNDFMMHDFPIPESGYNNLDPFLGFDIPFWFEEE